MTPQAKKKKLDEQTIKDGSTFFGQIMTKKFIPINDLFDPKKPINPNDVLDTKRYPTYSWLRVMSAITVAAETIEAVHYIRKGLANEDSVVSFKKAAEYIDFVSKTLPENHGVNLVVKKQWAPGGYTEFKFVGIEAKSAVNISKPDSDYQYIPIVGQQPSAAFDGGLQNMNWKEQSEFDTRMMNSAKGVLDLLSGEYPDTAEAYCKAYEKGMEVFDISNPRYSVFTPTEVTGSTFVSLQKKLEEYSKKRATDNKVIFPTGDSLDLQRWWVDPPSTVPLPAEAPDDAGNAGDLIPNPQPDNSPGSYPDQGGTPPSDQEIPIEPAPASKDDRVSISDPVQMASMESNPLESMVYSTFLADKKKINDICNTILSQSIQIINKFTSGGQPGAAPSKPISYDLAIDILRSIPARTKGDPYKAEYTSLQKAFFALFQASVDLKQVYKRIEVTSYEMSSISSVMQVFGYFKKAETAVQPGDLVFLASPDETGGGCWAVVIAAKDRTINEAMICHNSGEEFTISNTFLEPGLEMGEIVKVWCPKPYKVFADFPILNAFWGPNLLKYRGFLDNTSITADHIFDELFKGSPLLITCQAEFDAYYGKEIEMISETTKFGPGCIVFNENQGVAVVLRDLLLKGRINENNNVDYVNIFEYKYFKATSLWRPHL